jgi:hypothetical protein
MFGDELRGSWGEPQHSLWIDAMGNHGRGCSGQVYEFGAMFFRHSSITVGFALLSSGMMRTSMFRSRFSPDPHSTVTSCPARANRRAMCFHYKFDPADLRRVRIVNQGNLHAARLMLTTHWSNSTREVSRLETLDPLN